VLDRVGLFTGDPVHVRRVVCRPAGTATGGIEYADDDTLVLPVRGVANDSFMWLGERSTDGGASWRLEVEVHARRMAEPGAM
jgi:hypothetical protein